jgi:hypothetical protein
VRISGTSSRSETRIPVSKATLVALKSFLRGGEAYDTLIRRMLLSGIPKSIDRMSDRERDWVLNETVGTWNVSSLTDI